MKYIKYVEYTNKDTKTLKYIQEHIGTQYTEQVYINKNLIYRFTKVIFTNLLSFESNRMAVKYIFKTFISYVRTYKTK